MLENIASCLYSIECLHEWQTLIGSALGPFLAIILAAIAFFLRKLYKKFKDEKESIRRTEIVFSQVLNYLSISLGRLNGFDKRLDQVIDRLSKQTDPNVYVIDDSTIFPIMGKINFDSDLIKMEFKSYYLSNKILIIENFINWFNDNIKQFKRDYERVLEKHISIPENNRLTPIDHQDYYLKELSNFKRMLKKFLESVENDGIKLIVQGKAYNIMLKYSYFRTLWKYEGVSFRYFKNNKEIEKYSKSFETFDRIDRLIDPNVKQLIEETESQTKKNIMNNFKIGQFVTVGTDLGIIVGFPNGQEIPDEHLAIWYGEKTDEGQPKVRTVPQEYCKIVEDISYYH